MAEHNPKRVLILYASAGGGHKSVAEALSTAICAQNDKAIEVELIDILDAATTPKALTKIPELYPKVSKVPGVYNFIYNITNGQLRNRFIAAFNWMYGKSAITAFMADNPMPDLIITTFAFIGSGVLSALEELESPPPVVTVITDWGEVHSSWFDKRMAQYYTPTTLAKQSALENHIPARQVQVVGYPTDVHFVAASVDQRREHRANLKIGEDEFVVLLFGSSIGSDEIAASARKLVIALPEVKFIAITGHNEILAERLKAILPDTSAIFGFVDHAMVAELMSVADVMVSKSGGATIAEAINMHLPIVTYGYALEQERENTEFVVDRKIGLGAADSEEIVEHISNLVNNPAILAQMRTNCIQIARPQAAHDIAESLKKYL